MKTNEIEFIKMHGIANDYIYIDCFKNKAPNNPNWLAAQLSDRHRSVGGDGMVLILPEKGYSGRMRMFNADGSEGMMCGNAIRCVARYLYDMGYAGHKQNIITLDGEKLITINGDDICVDMAPPRFKEGFTHTLPNGVEARFYYVDVGSKHAVTYDYITACDEELTKFGRSVEALFEDGINVEFVQKISDDYIKIKVWERGSGITLACGTGSCAATAAGIMHMGLKHAVTCELTGGNLKIEWDGKNSIFMTGPAEYAMKGIAFVKE